MATKKKTTGSRAKKKTTSKAKKATKKRARVSGANHLKDFNNKVNNHPMVKRAKKLLDDCEKQVVVKRKDLSEAVKKRDKAKKANGEVRKAITKAYSKKATPKAVSGTKKHTRKSVGGTSNRRSLNR